MSRASPTRACPAGGRSPNSEFTNSQFRIFPPRIQDLPAFSVDIFPSLCYILFTLLEVLFLAKTLEYKGHPLQRKDNIIYYGSFADKYIIMMQILDTKKVKDLDVATKVSVQLQLTDPDLKSRDRVVKKSEKDSLYAAMDVASVWLDRALASR